MKQEEIMPTTSDGTHSPRRLKEAFELLSEAVRLLAVDANGRSPGHPPLQRALKLAEEAKEHIHTGVVSRD
jgi:hypothetical protein